MSLFLNSAEPANTPRSMILPPEDEGHSSKEPISSYDWQEVSPMRRLTDDEREAAIKRAGRLMLRYMGEWERTGCFAALGSAHRARRSMELLIAGRKR